MLAPHPHHPNLHVIEHPAVRHKLTRLRDERTDRHAFRSLLRRIAALMVYEATASFPVEPVKVVTPMEATSGWRLSGVITVVPVLRAGLGMADGVLELLPEARVGHIGLARDEATLQPRAYLDKLPRDLAAGPVLLVDPMLATGGSASQAATFLKQAGARVMHFLCLVAAPDGVRRMQRDHPDVPIYTAALDARVDERGFIHPGLGDAGDRLYGTG